MSLDMQMSENDIKAQFSKKMYKILKVEVLPNSYVATQNSRFFSLESKVSNSPSPHHQPLPSRSSYTGSRSQDYRRDILRGLAAWFALLPSPTHPHSQHRPLTLALTP